jgi:spore germination cell wall hydrolase CwlJ-like protein
MNLLPITIIAFTIAAESIGEGHFGRQCIASVIVNRSIERKLSPRDICRQKKQFSCWNQTTTQQVLNCIVTWNKNSPEDWAHCLKLATEIHNSVFCPVIKANHYYNPQKAKPSWRTKLNNPQSLGNHIFGSIDNRKTQDKNKAANKGER